MTGCIKTTAGENYLTESEEQLLFAHLKRLKDKQAERDFALMKLMRLLGLRVSEALALNVGDVINRTQLVIDERIACKGATGTLAMPKDLQEVLVRFIRQKLQWGEDLRDEAPLFVSRKGGRITRRAVNDLVDKWCQEAGVSRITPHGFRHTKGRRIMDDFRYLNPDERDRKFSFANKQLRHKSPAATMIYTVPNKEQMAKVAAI